MQSLLGTVSYQFPGPRWWGWHHTRHAQKVDIEVAKESTKKRRVAEGYVSEPTPGPGKRRVQQHRSSITSKKGRENAPRYKK